MRFKRGTTFSFSLQIPGQPDMTGWTGSAQVRKRNDDLVSDLAFVWDDQTKGQYTVTDLTTDNWPIEPVYFDVFFTQTATGVKAATITQTINVIENQTRL